MQYHFCGVGGSGMSALAQVLVHRGHNVQGSDRTFDRDPDSELARKLQALGIKLVPQDGSGLHSAIDEVVTSTAVEASIPDLERARELDLPLRHRSMILADLLNAANGIAVGGTSGKTTVTGMIGTILQQVHKKPTVINGGIMLNALGNGAIGNVFCGDPDMLVAEADESDGTIAHYWPRVSVVTNIGLDHKPMDELIELFSRFVSRAGVAVLNSDCSHCNTLLAMSPRCRTFGFRADAQLRALDVDCRAEGSTFTVNGFPVMLAVPGRHNVANALAAIAAVHAIGVPLRDAACAISEFRGIQRRMQIIGTAHEITVIDDFAHNPDKIAAALATLHLLAPRLRVWFQPHGFGPTRFLMAGIVRAFRLGLRQEDELHVAPIYYAGGTATRDVSSHELADGVRSTNLKAVAYDDREASLAGLIANAGPRDCVAILGARDPQLTETAVGVLAAIDARGPAR